MRFLKQYEVLFTESKPQELMEEALLYLYKDILEFHRKVLRQFRGNGEDSQSIPVI